MSKLVPVKQFRLFGIPVWTIRGLTLESNLSQPAPWLFDALGGNDTDSGVRINEEKALTYSAVYACVRVISEALACLPKHVYRKKGDREREILPEHYVSQLISFQPSEFYTPFDFFNTQAATVLLWGNAFAAIQRDKAYQPEALEIIKPSNVQILYNDVEVPGQKRKQRVLLYKIIDGSDRLLFPYEMLHFKGLGFDGIQGKGVIAHYAKESIGLSIVAEKFGARFFGKNTNLVTYFTMPGTLSEPAQKRLKGELQELTGIDNTFTRPPVFEQGLEPKNITIPPEQAQFLSTRQHQVEEICRWFKVQPHLVQHLLRSTNNNIEQQSIEFVMHTILPWASRMEQEMNIKLFSEAEKFKTYVKINVEGFLRGDMAAQKEYYKTMVQNGIWNPNEVRELQDKNPYDGGDTYYIPTNMMPSDAEPGLKKVNNKKYETTN